MEEEPFLPKDKNSRTVKKPCNYYLYSCLTITLLVFLISSKYLLTLTGQKWLRTVVMKTSLALDNDDILQLIPHNIHQLSKEQMFRNVEKESNLAAHYWYWWNNTEMNDLNNRKSNVQYCDSVSLTEPYAVQHNNLHWQRFDAKPLNPNEEVLKMYIYNAYYDSRVPNQPLVKLLTMNAQELMGSDRKWFCLLWFDGLKAPALVNVSDYYNIWPTMWTKKNRYGSFHPQLISCPIPVDHVKDIPRAVSLQARGNCAQVEQNPSNDLRVLNNRERDPKFQKTSFGVCVKAFRFADYDMSVRIVEWLEMLRMLGADRVYLYVYGTNENVQKVLKHYKKDGLIEWRFQTLPGEDVNVNSLYNLLAYKHKYKFTASESMELNDCLNRNMYQHDYVAVVDMDEVILPQGNLTNWQEIMAEVQNRVTEQDFRSNAYFKHRQLRACENQQEFDHNGAQIPDYLYLMRHTYRELLTTNNQWDKCFHRTDLVTSVHNHSPTRCLGTTGYFKCPGMNVPTDLSIMMHYRRNHVTYNGNNKTDEFACRVQDRTAWKYYDELRANVETRLKSIFKD